jgi:hypothetical protein
MSGPLIFISRSRVKPGKDEQYQEHVTEATALVETEEPQVIAFNNYRSDDGTEVSCVQVHADADSLDRHFKLFRERLSERAFESVDSYEVDIYGSPSDAALQFLSQLEQLRVRVLPLHDAGLLRPQPARSPDPS